MRTRITNYWSYLRASFWFLPIAMVFTAVLLFIGVDWIDRTLNPTRSAPWIYRGQAEGARQMMATIAGSMITIAGVTFSITIVALSFASQQFGPRLLRNFMRDVGNQFVLGTFTATFIYCVLVLRTIEAGTQPFVPGLSITVGVGLGLVSIIVLIYFIHHISSSIQANNVVAILWREANQSIDQLFPHRLGSDVRAEERPSEVGWMEQHRDEAKQIVAGKTGYLQALNTERLMELAVEHDLLVQLRHRPGEFIGAETLVAYVWPAAAVDDGVDANVSGCFIVGPNRSIDQDFEFAIHQFVEIGARALSPSFNDPFTAITALDHLGTALAELAQREMPSPYRRDDGRLRIVAPAVTYPQLVDASLQQLREYGRTHSAVMVAMLEVIARLAPKLRTDEQRRAVLRHAEMIERDALVAMKDPSDAGLVEERYREVRSLLTNNVTAAGS